MNELLHRRTVLSRLFTAFVLTSFFGSARLRAEDSITGEWELKMERNGRETFATLDIQKSAGGAYTAKWGGTELSDVKLDGQKLTFARVLKFGNNEFKLNYEGFLRDGAINGSLSSDRGTYTANATRRKPRSPILGRWEFKYTVADRDIVATLAVSEAAGGGIEGKWTSNFGEHVITAIKFQDGKLSLSRKSKLGDRDLETTYEGALKGNELSGAIKSELGEISANGRRLGADLIGRWELTSQSDQGPRTNLLTVFGDLTGRYEVFGSETPFKDLKLDGNQFSCAVELQFGDQPFKLDLKGKVDGKSLKGEVESPRGTREFTGKRIEAPAVSPIAGAWEIVREGRQGQRTVKLSIKEDMTGTYTSGDSTVPISDVRFEGDQLSFKFTVKYGDREVPTEFKGKVDGTAIKGQFITERGAREATGKKVGAAAGASL
jgi:hypothetical protein